LTGVLFRAILAGEKENAMPNLARRVLNGDIVAAAKLISEIEGGFPGALAELDELFPSTGKAQVTGITGPPGAGKSTLVSGLIGAFRRKEMTVGVIAIDPTSPFTGGAILGDRIRMQRYSLDKDVFIRSLATRDSVGGLARAAVSAFRVLDAMGKEIILVETVGSGQLEVDIARAADTTVVVLTPASGDNIQLMKAGIFEAADIFVINKADNPGCRMLQSQLEMFLKTKPSSAGKWREPIVLTEAVNDKGTDDLAGEILRHREFLAASGELQKRRGERAKLELAQALENFLKVTFYELSKSPSLGKLAEDVAQGRTNPYSATLGAARLLAQGKSAV